MFKLACLSVGGALAVLASCVSAEAACPNQITQVIIPMSGTSTYLPEDLLCNALPATGIAVSAVKTGAIASPTALSAASPAGFPNATVDVSGIHLGANGATQGAAWTLTFTYTPASVSVSLPGYAGAQVTGLVIGQ